MKKELICIACPIGCHLEIDVDNDYAVEGNLCKRGIAYGKKELTNPTRFVTSTVVIRGGVYPRIPVITSDEIPKDLIFEVMKEINQVVVESPIKRGTVVVENVCGTGVNVITSRGM